MVQAALLAGCRYSELARLKCANFNSDSGPSRLQSPAAGETVWIFPECKITMLPFTMLPFRRDKRDW
jgi:hypothetical protein